MDPRTTSVFVALVLSVCAACAACAGDGGEPRPRALPALDGVPALRGGGAPRTPRIASYKIDARLDVERHQIVATSTLTWTNPGASAVGVLPFHLYLNAFKNDDTLFMRGSRGEMRGISATPTGGGRTPTDTNQDDGAEDATPLVFPGPDETVAELTLPAPVAPGGRVEVTFAFTAQLPEVFARTGYKGAFHMIAQWFPKIGVRTGVPGSETWACEPHRHTTEFFADFGSYDVSVTVPRTHVVAATGVLTAAIESPDGTHTLTFHADDVHDFAWMADPFMEVVSRKVKLADGEVEVRVYHRPAQRAFAARHLDAAVGAVDRFSAWFVPYPWAVLTIIDPPIGASGAGGMEYPTLVTTAGDSVYARPGLRIPEFVTVHEIGHNWFQGLLASNEPIEAWLDEGVNEWADARVMNDLYGARGSIVDWLGWQAEITALRAAVSANPDSLPSPIATAAYAFVDADAYGEQTYAATARALWTLERTVGPQKFAAAMKRYAETWAFRHPTGRDLFNVLSAELGQDLGWFFGPVFQDVGGMRLGIRTAACRKAHPPRGVFGDGTTRRTVTEADAPASGTYVCEVVVTNTGTIHVPFDIELMFADGSTQRVRWDDRGAGNWQRFEVERSSELVEVWLDPDAKLALASPMRHRLRIAGDGSASLRAAAWVANGAQTLMQLVGP